MMFWRASTRLMRYTSGRGRLQARRLTRAPEARQSDTASPPPPRSPPPRSPPPRSPPPRSPPPRSLTGRRVRTRGRRANGAAAQARPAPAEPTADAILPQRRNQCGQRDSAQPPGIGTTDERARHAATLAGGETASLRLRSRGVPELRPRSARG